MKKKKLIKQCVFFSSIIILILVVLTIMLKYEVEGEKNLPYKLDKILMISTVDGDFTDDEAHIWNIDVTQTNDIYIYISPDGDTEETIKQISIQNFQTVKTPTKGKLSIYRPTGDLDNLYTYSVQDYIDSEIVYIGDKIDDMKALEVANNGGVVGFRVAIKELGSFVSNEATEIIYDGRLLSNVGITLEEIQFTLSFDIIIETNSDVQYKGTITLNMPTNEIIEQGSSNKEITDFSNIVFKRI